MKTTKNLVLGFLMVGVLMFTACASFNKSHTTNFMEQQKMVQQGQIGTVAQKLETDARKGGRDGVLKALQSGYYYLFMQDYDKSRELFKIAEDQIEKFEERAKLSARDVVDNAKSALASDMELPYKGEMFEKIMVNTMLAVNYLLKGDLEGANVEVRRAEIRQKEMETKHQEELDQIEKQKKKEKVDERTLDSIYQNYNILDEYAAKVISSFQNGFTYFLGGMVYELNKSANDAYQDYFKSFSLYKNKYTLEKLIELSKILNMQTEYEKWTGMYKELFNSDIQINSPISNSNVTNSELVVIYFCGNIPRKTEAKFSLWTQQKTFNVAFPFYDTNTFSWDNNYLEINHNGNLLGKTEIVLDFIPIVIKSLKEKLPGIVIRQIVRLISKNEVEKNAGKAGGIWGKLAAKIVNTVTERADLRGWYELPGNIQVFRTRIEPGTSTIALKEISPKGELQIKDLQLNIPNNGKALVLVQPLSSKLITHSTIL
ncbi:MAG: hypothetical protein MUF15_25460 [Acidobacteria bacterium]|jgi:hypothetical protein|nr:hypothetical protein [Acidobacteriota bacterium]